MLSPTMIGGLLEERRRQVERDLAACQKKADELRAQVEGAKAEDDLFFPLLTLQRSIALFQTDLSWIDETLAQFKQRQAQASAKRSRRRASTSSGRGRARSA